MPHSLPLRAERADATLARLQLRHHPQARRAAAGRLPGPAARPGQRAGRVARVPARRRRAADGLAGHRAHHRAARAPDDRRPGAGDLARRRPVGQPRLRHRPLPQARPGDRRGGRRRPPDRARRQPDRRGGGHTGDRRARLPARPGRKEAQGLLRAIARTPSRAGPGRPRRTSSTRSTGHRAGGAWPRSSPTSWSPPAQWARPLRKLGRPPRRARHRDRSTRASWSCPTSACWPSPTRRPVWCTRCRPPTRGCAQRYARGGRGPARPRSRPPSAQAGAAHLRLRTDSDWLLDIVRFVAAARHARTRGTTR